MRRKLFLFVLSAAVASGCGGCPGATPPSPDVLAVVRPSLPDDPDDRLWGDAPEHVAPLLLQDLVEPRLMEPSTTQVRVRAISDGAHVAFLLEWDDPELDDLPRAGHFVDACAVQLPAAIAADLPAPQMGEAERQVEIT